MPKNPTYVIEWVLKDKMYKATSTEDSSYWWKAISAREALDGLINALGRKERYKQLNATHPTYRIVWDSEDSQYVADDGNGNSWRALDPQVALRGLINLLITEGSPNTTGKGKNGS